jgi:hypothetical protein
MAVKMANSTLTAMGTELPTAAFRYLSYLALRRKWRLQRKQSRQMLAQCVDRPIRPLLGTIGVPSAHLENGIETVEAASISALLATNKTVGVAENRSN